MNSQKILFGGQGAQSRAQASQHGSALLEALIAIVVFSLGLLALAGAQANAIRAQGEARARADAAFVANQVVGDLWSLTTNQLAGCAGTYTADTDGCGGAQWGPRLAESLPNGELEIEVDNSQVTLTLTWQSPGSNEVRRYDHVANISRNN